MIPGSVNGAFVKRGFQTFSPEPRTFKPGEYLDADALKVFAPANLAAMESTGYLETTKAAPEPSPPLRGRQR